MTTAMTVAAPQWENQELLDTIKQTVCKGATDAQFRMFIEVCKATGLNPFLKEIWFVPSVGVMAGRDAYLKKANEHPQFDGMETRVERDDKNVPIKAVCTVWRKDRGHPIIAEAYYNEYRKSGAVWQTYPSAMIAKVAEVLALKRSFAINGIVTEEEIGNPEERGSKEAQREYLASRGIGLPGNKARCCEGGFFGEEHDCRKSKPTSPEVIHELADALDQPPAIKTIEMRHASQVAEADAALAEVKKPAKRKKGGVSFETLKHFKELKGMLRDVTGDDLAYYTRLRDSGYEHSDEIKDDAEARGLYKALLLIHKRATEQKQLLALFEHSSEVIGVREFTDLLGVHGAETMADAMQLGGDALGALLTELKAKVDEHAPKDSVTLRS